MKNILLVDDDQFFLERLAMAFKARNFTVFTAGNYDEAVAIILEHRPGLGVFDLKMPGRSGLDLVRKARTITPEMFIIILTGYGSIATAMEAVKLGALYYLQKPADVDDILNAFARETANIPEKEADDFDVPSLARAEWEHINRVLEDCGGNISVAAKKLGLHRRTLQRKLYKYAPRK